MMGAAGADSHPHHHEGKMNFHNICLKWCSINGKRNLASPTSMLPSAYNKNQENLAGMDSGYKLVVVKQKKLQKQ